MLSEKQQTPYENMKIIMKGNKNSLGHKQTKEHIENSSNGRMKKEFRTKGLSKDEVLIGLILSDAHITSIPNEFRNSKFQMSQSIKYEEMIDFTSKYLNDLGFDTTRKTFTRKTGISSTNIQTKNYPDFTELRKVWYPIDVKIVPRMLTLTPKSLAFWFMGDGSSRWAYKHFTVEVQFCTESFNISDCLFLKYQLEMLGIIARVKPYRKGYRLLIKSKKDVTCLMNAIKPHMLKCFWYKVKIPEDDMRKPLWQTDKSRTKCAMTTCTKTAPKGRKTCSTYCHTNIISSPETITID